MGRGQRDDIESKSKLVTEICSIATRSIACIHGCCGSKSPFIDWYLLLRVGEDAETDVIRKQYRKLALQLHPDKNSHPKAEVAFKLVSEAYACLSDEAKRRVFNTQRWNNSCAECKRIPGKSSGSNSAMVLNSRILRRMKEVRDRFREEARIIENFLKTKKASCEESPVFNPSNNPHQRSQNYLQPDNLHYLRTSSVKSHRTGSRYMFDLSSGCYESLTFKIGSESRSFRNFSTRFNSKCKVH